MSFHNILFTVIHLYVYYLLQLLILFVSYLTSGLFYTDEELYLSRFEFMMPYPVFLLYIFAVITDIDVTIMLLVLNDFNS